jgi:hypothetical protein
MSKIEARIFVREGRPGWADDDYVNLGPYSSIDKCLKDIENYDLDLHFPHLRGVHGYAVYNDKYYCTNTEFGKGINNAGFAICEKLIEVDSFDKIL